MVERVSGTGEVSDLIIDGVGEDKGGVTVGVGVEVNGAGVNAPGLAGEKVGERDVGEHGGGVGGACAVYLHQAGDGLVVVAQGGDREQKVVVVGVSVEDHLNVIGDAGLSKGGACLLIGGVYQSNDDVIAGDVSEDITRATLKIPLISPTPLDLFSELATPGGIGILLNKG